MDEAELSSEKKLIKAEATQKQEKSSVCYDEVRSKGWWCRLFGY
jgi:hypothetical protein